MFLDIPDVVPHTCLYLDTTWKDICYGIRSACYPHQKRSDVLDKMKTIWTTPSNPNHVLPCYSVRTGLDLFLRVKSFPKGSEVIMSAINIPTMAQVIRHHGLTVVPIDISIETMAPKMEYLDSLVTDKTVAILVAHIYGKKNNIEDWLQAAKKHNLYFLEDCAEAFCGFSDIGHPDADVTFFSFGTIKFSTAFGGAICKIKDKSQFDSMQTLYSEYPIQPKGHFLKKMLKVAMVYGVLNSPTVLNFGYSSIHAAGMESPRSTIIALLRGFSANLIHDIRFQPSTPLLMLMFRRFQNFDAAGFNIAKVKGDYMSANLPPGLTQIGKKAEVLNYWLFPILVENPDEFVKRLFMLGIDGFRGATQLNVIEPTNGIQPENGEKELHRYITHDPTEARYLIDHVVYIPVHKHVPFHYLDKICKAVEIALQQIEAERPVKIPSKL